MVTYRATLDGGIKACKSGSLPAVLGQIRWHLEDGHRVYLRCNNEEYRTVTFTGLPAEAVAHNIVGDQVDLPGWVEGALRLLNNP